MDTPIVLSVEDSDADFFFMEMVLQDCPSTFKLMRAADGEEAVRFLRNIPAARQPWPRLVMLDVNLPRLNGFEVLDFIKSQEFIREIPVVLFTSAADPKERKRAIDMGAEEYITKPSDVEGMVTILNEVCNRYLQQSRAAE